MIVNIDLIKLLRKDTNISIKKCFEILKVTKNNYELSKKLILEENIDNIIIKKNKFYKIFVYLKKNYSVLVKCKFQSSLIFFLKEINYLIKKIIYLLFINKYKNILLLLNSDLINIKNLIKSFIIKTSENFKIEKFSLIKYYKLNITYNYQNKICLIINYINYKKIFLTKNMCIHIIFYKPIFISLKSINIEIIKKIYKILNKKISKNKIKEKILIKIFLIL